MQGVVVSASYRPLLQRIGEELERVPGLVRVTGHTDSQPIRTVRFPSNWHLSQERARVDDHRGQQSQLTVPIGG